jgi:hypothetical protein
MLDHARIRYDEQHQLQRRASIGADAAPTDTGVNTKSGGWLYYVAIAAAVLGVGAVWWGDVKDQREWNARYGNG